MNDRKNPETSLEAYRSLDVKTLNERYKLILYALSKLGEATTEECAAFLKVDHVKIWKRYAELEKMELIYRPGNKRLLKSGRNGYTWMLRSSVLPKTNEQLLVYKIQEEKEPKKPILTQATLFY